MKPFVWYVMLVVLSVGYAPAALADEDKGGIDWANGYIMAVGHGTAKASEARGKARLKAVTAAKVDAQRNLLEVIRGVKITAQTTVQDSMLVEDLVRTRIEGMLKGAFMAGEPQLEMVDGAPVATVIMKVCLNGGPAECAARPSLVSALDLPERPVPPYVPTVELTAPEPPKLPPPAAVPQGGSWRPPVYDSSKPVSGLIFCLDGRHFERELLPVVITQGQPDKVTVYSVKTVTPGVVRTYGVVRYTDSVEGARQQQVLGANPMIVFADSVTRENMIMIRSQDAKLIRETTSHGNNYLNQAKVVISVR